MAKNVIRTSKRVAKIASTKLRTSNNKAVKALGAEALENRKSNTKKRG